MKKRKFLLLLSSLFLLTSCEDFLGIFDNGKTNTPDKSDNKDNDRDDGDGDDSTIDDDKNHEKNPEEKKDPTALDGYTLYWNDEFESESLDTSKWENQIGNGEWGWGNNESQYYTSENTIIQNGDMIIRAKAEAKDGFSYTSSRLRTAGKFSVKYGRIQARIALPNVRGLWPAFWMLPENSYENQGWPHSGEIDIMENKGRLNNMTSAALHFSNDSNSHTYLTKEHYFKGADFTTDYHVYGIEWDSEKIEWFVDDEVFFTATKNQWHTASYNATNDDAPFNQNFHILLNMAVGGTFDTYTIPPSDFTSADMKIDYVRVYKKNG